MGLRDLSEDISTNWNDYPFSDRPNGGKSNQPYITSEVGNSYALPGNVSNDIEQVSENFIRGGAQTSIARSAIDTNRISKFLIDSPKGPSFILKQVALQRGNVAFEAYEDGPSLNFSDGVGGFIKSIGDILTDNGTQNRKYNLGVNTLAQVGVNAFGLHFKRHGLIPSLSSGEMDPGGYSSIVKSRNNENKNRLVYFKDKLRLGYIDSTETGNIQSNKVLYTYPGGPGSIYGIGVTTICSWNTTNPPRTENLGSALSIPTFVGSQSPLNLLSQPNVDYVKGVKSHTPDGLGKLVYNLRDEPQNYYPITQKLRTRTPIVKSNDIYPIEKFQLPNGEAEGEVPYIDGEGENGDPSNESYSTKINEGKLVDDAKNLYNYLAMTNPSVNFKKANSFNGRVLDGSLVDFRKIKGNQIFVNLGADPEDPEKTKFNLRDRIGIDTGYDLISSFPVGKGNVNPADENNEGGFNDFVKFRIHSISPDTGEEQYLLAFRALLDGFGDSFNADWDSHNFTGNPEKFYTYAGFDRDFNINFKIAAESKDNLKPIYQKLNYLISLLHPNYKYGFTRARAPFIKLTVGSYLSKQPGFIKSLNIDWKTDYPWEINIGYPSDGEHFGDTQVLPHVLDISLQFKPIHSFVPRNFEEGDEEAFITLPKERPETWVNTTFQDTENIKGQNNGEV